MSSQSWYWPRTEAEQVAFSQNMATKVFLNPELYGVTEDRAEALKELNIVLQAKWTAAITPDTRSKISIAQKNVALKAVKLAVADVVSIIRGQDLTEDQLLVVGLTPKKSTRTPSPVPTTSPVMVAKVDRRTVFVQLKGEGSTGRGKPMDAAAAVVMVARGATPPASIDGWTFSTVTGRTAIEIPFESGPAETVWVSSFWTNSRNESGPSATPLRVELPAGTTFVAETGEDSVRLAA